MSKSDYDGNLFDRHQSGKKITTIQNIINRKITVSFAPFASFVLRLLSISFSQLVNWNLLSDKKSVYLLYSIFYTGYSVQLYSYKFLQRESNIPVTDKL